MGGPGSGRKKGSKNKYKSINNSIAKTGQLSVSRDYSATKKHVGHTGYSFSRVTKGGYSGRSPTVKSNFMAKNKKPLKLSKSNPYFVSKAARKAIIKREAVANAKNSRAERKLESKF